VTDNQSLPGSGLGMVVRNLRYVIWFFVLNLALAWFGTAAFRFQAKTVLDHSLYSDRLVHGFDLAALIELLARPEFGPTKAPAMAATGFICLFFLATAIFLPGVFQGYASTYRLPRDDFFRACGRNLWRFVRLLLVAGIVFLVVTVAMFAIQGALVKKAGDSTNELLPFEVQMAGLTLIFLVMTTLRIWFDLAEVDVVLSDQRAVRRSIASGFRHTFRSLGRLLGSYVLITILAAILLVAGLWSWIRIVPSQSVFGAFLISQVLLLLLLTMRFWQRGVAVAYWRQRMLVPVVVMEPIVPEPVLPPRSIEPLPSPVIATTPPEPQGSAS
jgi:hypothetical protein